MTLPKKSRIWELRFHQTKQKRVDKNFEGKRLLLVSNKEIRSSRINSDLGGIYNIYSIYSFPFQSVTAILPFVSPDNFFQTFADKSDLVLMKNSVTMTKLC